jgi:hypothetical protein
LPYRLSGLHQLWGEVGACPTGSIFHKEKTEEKTGDLIKLEFLANARENHEWTL